MAGSSVFGDFVEDEENNEHIFGMQLTVTFDDDESVEVVLPPTTAVLPMDV